MDDKERSTSLGAVVAFGFILLGILNLFARQTYRLNAIRTSSRFPGILFIGIGLTILLIKFIQKARD